jgi:hypothetical protein
MLRDMHGVGKVCRLVDRSVSNNKCSELLFLLTLCRITQRLRAWQSPGYQHRSFSNMHFIFMQSILRHVRWHQVLCR